MSARFDHVVIGAGHNGLTCAAYLARSGARVLVLEAADAVGGAAATGEIAPGFRVSRCAHILNQLHPTVAADLGLEKTGLQFAAVDIPTTILGETAAVRLLGDAVTGDVSGGDAAAYAALRKRLLKFARHLSVMLLRPPPSLGRRDWKQTLDLVSLGLAIRRLGRDDMREFLRVAGMNVADLVEDEFDSDLLKAAIAVDGILGTHMGPRSPGTVLTLLYRLTGVVGGRQGALALPRGGMGAVTAALAASAGGAGAEIRTGARVSRILVEKDRAVGVELASGERIEAGSVISNAAPGVTLLKLLGGRHLDIGFQYAVGRIRSKGTAAKVNLALDGLPEFRGLAPADAGGRILLADSVDGIELAFNACKYGDYSSRPMIELVMPSITDPALAPAGRHVLSAIVQYAPYGLKAGWEATRSAFLETVLDRLEAAAPGMRKLVVASEVLTPPDLEAQFGLPQGHWHHGELAIDQLLMVRPVAAAARYAAPVAGLYLCGAGCHPGGGVMGAAGYNAARMVLATEKAA